MKRKCFFDIIAFIIILIAAPARPVDTQLEVVKLVAHNFPHEGTIADFAFCRQGASEFILFHTGQLFRIAYESGETQGTSIFPLPTFAAPPNCSIFFSAGVDLLDSDMDFAIRKSDGATGETIEEFRAFSDEVGIDHIFNMELNPDSEHLFLLVRLLPDPNDIAIMEFDWNAKQFVSTMPIPDSAALLQRDGTAFDDLPAFSVHPETEEFFIELAGNDGWRRVGRFSPDGILQETFRLPPSPLLFDNSGGNGLAIDPATDHLFVYSNGSGGHGFFELAPAAPNASKSWKRYE